MWQAAPVWHRRRLGTACVSRSSAMPFRSRPCPASSLTAASVLSRSVCGPAKVDTRTGLRLLGADHVLIAVPRWWTAIAVGRPCPGSASLALHRSKMPGVDVSPGHTVETRATPPTAPGSFVLGNIRDIGRDPLEFLTTTARTHGDVVRYRLATYDFYLVTHPEGVQRILLDNNRNYTRNGSVF